VDLVAVASQKGGAGKTTIVVHLAVAAAIAGERVVVIDTDPQGSATSWGRSRSRNSQVVLVEVRKASALDLLDVCRRMEADGFSVAIVDTEPKTGLAASRALELANLALMPLRPSAFDVDAIGATATLVRATAVPAAAWIINACPPRAPEVAQTRAVLREYEFPIAGELGERRAYRRAVSTGRSVIEFEPNGSAAEEIRSLWSWCHATMRPVNHETVPPQKAEM